MTEFYNLLALILVLMGIDTRPKIELVTEGLASYSAYTDTVHYNYEKYPCEKDIPLCIVVIAHEIGGHRYALFNDVTPNNEEFAYLQAINITAQLEDNTLSRLDDNSRVFLAQHGGAVNTGYATRANEIAYDYWWDWHKKYAIVCHDEIEENNPFFGGC